jgi:TonB family protein
MKSLLLLLFIVLPALVRVPATPRSQGGVEHFSKDGLSFDYPAGWTLEDKSKDEIQHLVLRRPDSSVLLMVVAQRDPAQDATLLHAGRAAITRPYVANIARLMSTEVPDAPVVECLPVGESLAVGYRMAGRLGQEQSTGEVYAVAKGPRLIHLFYVRQDKDEAAGAQAWKTLADTLKVEQEGNPPPGAAVTPRIIEGGVINGKALKKPHPSYPPDALRAGATGTVTVQIVVDEKGDVISAKAISGHVLLRGAGEAAARRAKFTPTSICGKALKVTGVITYNFVMMR